MRVAEGGSGISGKMPGRGGRGRGHREARPRTQSGGQARQSRWQRSKADMFREGSGLDSKWVPI